jgi:hypothetical protein
LARDLEQLIVRDAAPEEKGQPRGELEVAHAERLSGRDVRRLRLELKHEPWTHEQPRQGVLNAGVEVAVAPALRIELE